MVSLRVEGLFYTSRETILDRDRGGLGVDVGEQLARHGSLPGTAVPPTATQEVLTYPPM